MSTIKYKDKIISIHQNLGISDQYSHQFGLTLQYEENDLVDIGNDIYGRPQKLMLAASKAWAVMRGAAATENIQFDFVSAFRSVEHQVKILQRKIENGQSISEILKTSAAPGYSEHHTGRAIDITTNECEPLSESFETTEAFQWLMANAKTHHFNLSYPRNNTFGITYEPWHWAYTQS